ncbi:hypothetical protein GGX14DRAFT_580805 [Mycena pura]|uniref:Uncharacterized protein n=1 Tax=Mycena pura TaxID=153505 RepID=A0AAD6Y0V4_9AGAR|nr:hypothetical protein GGX14DRAFT_580805 [Mycena pura]
MPAATSSEPQQASRSTSSHKAWSKLSRWLRGPDMVMELDVDPDALAEWRKTWESRWAKYREDLPDGSLDYIKGMGKTELRERSNWLETEFTRIRENIPVLSNDTNDPQILAGLIHVGEMLDNCQADLIGLMTAARADIGRDNADSGIVSPWQVPMDQLKIVEQSHMFALTCINKIITLKQAQVVASRNQVSIRSQTLEANVQISQIRSAASDHSQSMRSGSSSPRGSILSQNVAPEEDTTNDIQMSSVIAVDSNIPLNSANLLRASTLANHGVTFRSDDLGPGRFPPPPGRDTTQQPQNAATVSTSSSHMKNLTVLLAIAFFGASITWSTVFSGARGDLGLISWSAGLFIVGAVGAGAASMLVAPEEDIVAKHRAARWTVRILSLLATAHVLGGMFLVALAMLVLDPAQEGPPQARAGRLGVRSAGAYATAVSALFVAVAGAVWRRYTIRTWFRR